MATVAAATELSLPLSLAARVDRICDRFENAWNAGLRPRIEDELQGAAASERPALLTALLSVELENRRAHGENPIRKEYHERFADDVQLCDEVWMQLENTDAKMRSSDAVKLTISQSKGVPTKIGRFCILELLGCGGFGVVYKAQDPDLDRIVALKVPHANCVGESDLMERFLREARSTAQLKHPGIVEVYEIGYENDVPFIVSDYIDGKTLADAQDEREVSVRESAELVRQLALALQYAHDHQIVHRDVKPRNVLMDSAGKPKLTDFGLARRSGSETTLTLDGQVIGTPCYMSPEQAAGSLREVDARADIYSLGVVLYQLLTGQLPFPGDYATILNKLLYEEPISPRQLNSKIPRDLERIVIKCLQKTPDHRYASAAALAADLEAFLNNDPVSASSSGIVHLVSRLARQTQHAPVLNNYGLAWMGNGLMLLVLFVTTNWMQLKGITSPRPYLGFWSIYIPLWAYIYWKLRRPTGPLKFVERQVAHIWTAGRVFCGLVLVVETRLDLPFLTLAPVFALVGAYMFLVKAAIFSGKFYVQVVAYVLCARVMFTWPEFGLTSLGIVEFAAFFFPGWKYYRENRRSTLVTRQRF